MARQLPISPQASSSKVSNVMMANKARDTKPELQLRNFLWANGFRGYRVNWKKAPGRPDVCYPGKKIALFVHGCFWHRCPKCTRHLPKSNTDFWKRKFELNVSRDVAKRQLLEEQGWSVLELWECELKTGDLSIVREFLSKV
jgi:DNA mismatch endonuclease (patch repair protein)